MKISLITRLKHLKPRKPDFIIGGADKPYMRRWWLTPRMDERYKIYLHNILRDDDDRALHDHPSHSVSIILRGGYWEHLPNGVKKLRLPSMIIRRRADAAHRLELRRDKQGNIIPAWTIFIFGPKVREWGFLCPRGWVHWRDFTSSDDSSVVGRGCE